jgi:putative spermidine/putrescine transport system substrate-binding protein
MRRDLLTALAVALSLAGCKKEAPPPPPQAAPAPAPDKPEGQVNIVAWPGYIERGETDKSYDWVTQFEKESGCKVNVKTAATSDEMVQLMTSSKGEYDLVTASGDASLRLVAAKAVQPVDLARVPSYGSVDDRLKGAPWYTVDGKSYGVPYQWGPNVLMYNTKVFKSAPTSWAVVFEPQKLPDGKPNKGRVQAYDGPIYVADAALYLMKKKPDLGIQDPYELDEKQYTAALEVLRKQKTLTHRYWHDATVQMSDFKNEGVVASSSWGYMANALAAEKQPIASTIPAEGSTGWADTTMLHASAKNPNCAYKWMEWSLNAKLQSALAEWFGSVPVVPAACQEKAPGASDFCKVNGFDRFGEVHFWRTPTAECKSQGTCVPYSRWVTDYIAIMGGR